MKHRIFVSVILPVYNAEKYLRECLDSLACQTLHEAEFICIDDGSTDNSRNILAEYAMRDSRFRLVVQENSGAGAARNAGIDLAKGEYLSFLDADDFFEPEMLEYAYTSAKRGDADVVVFGCDLYNDKNGKWLRCPWSIKRRWLPDTNPFSPKDIAPHIFNFSNGWAWDKLFRKEFVEQTGLRFMQQRTTNDMFFVFASYARARSIMVLEPVFAHHRMNLAGSLTNTRSRSWDCFVNALLKLRKELETNGVFERFEKSFCNFALELCCWNINSLAPEARDELIAQLRYGLAEQLGLCGHDSNYFYYQTEYARMKYILDGGEFAPESKIKYAGKLWDTLRYEGVMSVYWRIINKLTLGD